MSLPADGTVALVVVPDADCPVGPLVAALRRWHPTWEVRTVWAGDPQFAPSFGARAPAPVVAADVTEAELVALDPAARPVLVGLRAVDDRPTVVLVAGSVAVLGPLVELVARPGRLTVVPRCLGTPDGSGAPGLAELGRIGRCSESALGVGAGARESIRWVTDRLLDPDPATVGVLLDLAVDLFGGDRCADERLGVSVWRWSADDPVLVEAPGHDPSRPWLLAPDLDGPPRVSVAAPTRRAVLQAAAEQLGAGPRPLRLPGGIEVDDAVRAVVRHDPPDGLRPWTDAAAFRAHLATRYWAATHALRRDLQIRFPSPTGADGAAFGRWARNAAFVGDAPLLLDPSGAVTDLAIHRTGDSPGGVNVVGYLHHQSGIGNVARRIVDVLDRHGVPHSAVAYGRTENPRLHAPPRTDQELRYSTSIVVVNGDQFPTLRSDVPDIFGPGRRVIGVWFWELETLDGAARVGDDLVDEIWSATHFMAGAFRALGTAPVRVVPLPFHRPVGGGRTRPAFESLEEIDGRFVFGVVFDHLSVTARKNPLGAIEAFRTAFDVDDGAALVIKTINGDRCWHDHEQLLAATADRPDIVVWDEHLCRADHDAFIASLDALVSLHRSEGLGLHLAEAMSLGVPVIATRYSGNLDFMDDDTAYLVDADPVAVGSDGGWAYPATARWAGPNLTQAAEAMRVVVDDPRRRATLVAAAQESIAAYADEATFVDTVLGLFGPVVRPGR